MGIISEISPQKKNKGRVNLYIDGEFVCGLDAFTAEKYRLREGAEIAAAKLYEISFDSECESAFLKAMNFLHIRLRTESEMKRYLQEKGYEKKVVGHTIEKLNGYGYLNDAAFTKAYIASYRNRYGIRKIEFLLKGMGIDSEILAAVLEETEKDQSDEAFHLAQKFMRGKKELNKNKLYAHLCQKGFDSDAAKGAIEKIEEEILDEENT